jgi:hypothetical protein
MKIDNSPRYATTDKNLVFLGQYYQYDLYFAEEMNKPKWLIARYGDNQWAIQVAKIDATTWREDSAIGRAKARYLKFEMAKATAEAFHA